MALDPRERANRTARGVIKALAVTALGIAVYLHIYQARFGGLSDWRAMDAAQVGLNVAQGRGLTTSVIYPLAVDVSPSDTTHQDIRQNPLYPMVLAAFMKLRGPGDQTVAMANGLLMLLGALLLYFLAAKLFDRGAALFAAAAYLVSMEALGEALSCTAVGLGALLLTASVLCGLKLTEAAATGDGAQGARPSPRTLLWAAAAGLFLGLAYLAGGLGILAAVGLFVVLAWAFARRARLAVLGVLLAAFLVTLAPWAARNLRAFGTPWLPSRAYELVMHTSTFPGASILWSAPERLPNPLVFALTHPKRMAGKVARGLSGVYRTIPGLVSLYLWPFLALGFFVTARTPTRTVVWKVLVVGVALGAANLCLADLSDQSGVMCFLPIATVLAVGVAVQVIRERVQSVGRKWGAAIGLCALAAFPYAASTLLGTKVPSSYDVHSFALLNQAIDKADLTATDVAWDFAWYTGRQALLLPGTPGEFKRVLAAGVRPGYVHLSSNVGVSPRSGMGRPAWVAIARGQVSPVTLGIGLPLPMPNGELLIELPFAKHLVSERLRKAAAAAKAEASGAKPGQPAGVEPGQPEQTPTAAPRPGRTEPGQPGAPQGPQPAPVAPGPTPPGGANPSR